MTAEMTYSETGDAAADGSAVSFGDSMNNVWYASNWAANDLGLADKPTSEWTQNERVAYLEAFRQQILANAESFTPQTVQIAARMNPSANWTSPGDVADANFGVWVGDHIEPIARTVGATADLYNGMVEAVSNLGKAIGTASKASPLLVAGAFLMFLYFSSRAVGKDPAGQVRKLLPY